jgi:hypothetical protein
MRLIGLILVIVGALALGYQGFEEVWREPDEGSGDALHPRAHRVRIPLVVGGIAVVGGLLLVASGSRRGEN